MIHLLKLVVLTGLVANSLSASAQSADDDALTLRAVPALRSLSARQPGLRQLRKKFAESVSEQSRTLERQPGSQEISQFERDARKASFIRRNMLALSRKSSRQLRVLRQRSERDEDLDFELDQSVERFDELDTDRNVLRNLEQLLRDQMNGLRVVGGERAQPGDGFETTVGWRRYAEGEITEHDYCTGVLVHEQWVATAAHCVCKLDLDQNENAHSQVRFVFGEIMSRFESKLESTTRNLVPGGIKLMQDEFCDNLNADNNLWLGHDLALMRLDRPASPDIRPSDIASADLFLSPSTGSLTVAGFGRTYLLDYDAQNPAKHFAEIVIASKLCDPQDRSARLRVCHQNREMILADTRADTCGGDSGGPVYLADHGRYMAIGITSRGVGEGCGRRGGVYTILSPKVKRWIDEMTSGDSEPQLTVTENSE